MNHPDFWFGTTVGIIAAILTAEPAAQTLRKFMSTDIRIEQLNKEIAEREKVADDLRKSMSIPQADLIKRLEIQRDQLDVEKVVTKQCHQKVVDLEFRLDAARSYVSSPDEICLRELTSVKGVKLREGEGSRQVGGRLYFGASMVASQPSNSFCKLRWSTDVQPPANRTNEKLLNPGEQVTLNSTVGTFHLALTRVSKDDGGNYCLLDLVRAR